MVTTIRPAHTDGTQGSVSLRGARSGVLSVERPSLLVSFAYLAPFVARFAEYKIREWVLDSGAFTAHAKGEPVCVEEYGDTCAELLADPVRAPCEVFSLDVIGDWKASAKNTDALWARGIPAIPCFHVGSPESELRRLARDFPKIALGGAVGYRQRDEWAAQCFARVWPKRIHGFGFGSEKSVLALPWHSVDATSWEIGPCRFGNWRAYGDMSARGSRQDLRDEIAWYMDLERKARARWRKEMAVLGEGAPLAVRLATHRPNHSGPGIIERERAGALDSCSLIRRSIAPSVRLAAKASGRESNFGVGKNEDPRDS